MKKRIIASEEVNTFQIPITWGVTAVYTVQAHNLKQAIQQTIKEEYNLPIAKGTTYKEGSFEINYDSLEDDGA